VMRAARSEVFRAMSEAAHILLVIDKSGKTKVPSGGKT
jgi:hypothetical protein